MGQQRSHGAPEHPEHPYRPFIPFKTHFYPYLQVTYLVDQQCLKWMFCIIVPEKATLPPGSEISS